MNITKFYQTYYTNESISLFTTISSKQNYKFQYYNEETEWTYEEKCHILQMIYSICITTPIVYTYNSEGIVTVLKGHNYVKLVLDILNDKIEIPLSIFNEPDTEDTSVTFSNMPYNIKRRLYNRHAHIVSFYNLDPDLFHDIVKFT